MFDISNSPDSRTILRFAIYTLLIASISGMLPVIVDHSDAYIFSEGGPVEWLQAILLLGTALIFLIAAKYRKNSSIDILLCIVAMIAFVREMDSILDRLIPRGGWYVPAAMLLAVAIVLCWKRRDFFFSGHHFFRYSVFCFAVVWFYFGCSVWPVAGSWKLSEFVNGRRLQSAIQARD